MTNEELDEARAKEAARIWREQGSGLPWPTTIAARLAREGWMPPEPGVDPDVLAWREWFKTGAPTPSHDSIDAGEWDHSGYANAFRAGVRYAREEKP